MDTEQVINFLAEITTLSQAFINAITAELVTEHYRASQIIQGAGQTETRLWFLKCGLARSYIYDSEGQQHTLRFWNANDVIFSYAGYFREPSPEYIELLVESTLYSCTYVRFAEILENHPEAAIIVAEINRRYLLHIFNRCYLHSMNTKRRYQIFRKENSELFKTTPLRIIASYLQMSRENLSRIISEEQ